MEEGDGLVSEISSVYQNVRLVIISDFGTLLK